MSHFLIGVTFDALHCGTGELRFLLLKDEQLVTLHLNLLQICNAINLQVVEILIFPNISSILALD